MGPDIFGQNVKEIGHNFELARWILMKVVAFQVKTMRIQILKARGPGKFCSSRTTRLKVGAMDEIFEKVSFFSALPGAHAP